MENPLNHNNFDFQSQLGHGTGFPYSTAPGGGRPDYSVAAQQRPHDDPLSLHQALGQAVEEAQAGLDDNTGFISDLPLLKSMYSVANQTEWQAEWKNVLRGKPISEKKYLALFADYKT